MDPTTSVIVDWSLASSNVSAFSYQVCFEMAPCDLLSFALPVADFVTGVPKGLMLYGVVRSPCIFILQQFTVQIVQITVQSYMQYQR